MGSLEYFQTVASDWDQMRSRFFSEAVREKALSTVSVLEGQTAADVGAGTGFISEALLKRGLKVIAVDQSPEMLQQMGAKFDSAGPHWSAAWDLRRTCRFRLPRWSMFSRTCTSTV